MDSLIAALIVKQTREVSWCVTRAGTLNTLGENGNPFDNRIIRHVPKGQPDIRHPFSSHMKIPPFCIVKALVRGFGAQSIQIRVLGQAQPQKKPARRMRPDTFIFEYILQSRHQQVSLSFQRDIGRFTMRP